MKLTNILSDARKYFVKKSPTIFAGIAGLGVLATVVSASKASKKVDEDIKKRREEIREETGDEEADISNKEKAKIYAKDYAPTIAIVLATEACIYESNHINQKRLAALGAAYILKETNFKEYKEKVEEMVGTTKAQQIKDDLIQQHIDDTPQTQQNIINHYNPSIPQLSLWYDETSKRYFYSNADIIRRAEAEATIELKKEGFVSLNRVYELLGVEGVYLGDENGWSTQMCDEVIISIDGHLSGRTKQFGGSELMGGSAVIGPDIPIGTITMEIHPNPEWYMQL